MSAFGSLFDGSIPLLRYILSFLHIFPHTHLHAHADIMTTFIPDILMKLCDYKQNNTFLL